MTTNKELFSTLQDFLDEVNATNSVNEKKDILAKYPKLVPILNYVYDPFKKYHVTTEQLDKYPDLWCLGFADFIFYKILDMLYQRIVTGHEAIGLINDFISHYKEYEDIIRLVIGKDLKCRLGASSINKVFPGTVPEFKVALAKEYEDSMASKMNWEDWLVMRKLDGVRCIVKIDENSNARFFSRKGHEFHTLGVIAEEIKKLNIKNIVLDGEVCLIDKEGKEDFQKVVGLVKRKNYTISNPKLIVFDVLTHKEFTSGFSPIPYIDRLCLHVNQWSESIICIKVALPKNEENLEALKKQAVEDGWEGLMLREALSPYRAKKTKNLLKVKTFFDAEYTVYDYGIGPFRVINKKTKLEEEIITLTNVLITHKGHTVSVGSGFSIDERKYYFEHPDEIVGKEITVKYFEETTNKDGGISLRFPTIKKIWTEGKRDV